VVPAVEHAPTASTTIDKPISRRSCC
jgi:hypothetical protein